jgi:hypothetical protein
MKYILTSILFVFSSFFSFGQKAIKDTASQNKIVAFKMFYDYSGYYNLPIDTSLSNFQVFNYAFTDFAINEYLGNLGSAVLPLYKQDNAGGYDLIFNKYIRYNFYKPEKVINYRTKTPYTVLTYHSSGPKSRQEQNFQFIHTQNVNKYLNVGFLGKLIYSDGQYANNLIKGNSFCLFSSYDGPRYNFNLNICLSTLKLNEYGGLLVDTSYEETNNPTYTLPVRLQSARSSNRDFTIFLQHKISLTGSYKEDSTKGPSRWNDAVSLIHRLQYEKASRSFKDYLKSSSGTLLDRDYYSNINIDSTNTNDSAYFRRLENSFLLALNAYPVFKIPAELRFGIKNQLDKISYSTPIDTSINYKDRQSYFYINSALIGSLTNRFSKTISWGASAELYFTGYKAGNLYLTGDISKTIKNNFEMTLKGDFGFEKTPYFLQKYESNHFSWDNTSTFNSRQSYTIVKASFIHSKYKIALEGENGSYINYIYFDSAAMPKMADQPISMLRVTIRKSFDWKVLHSTLRSTIQKTTNEKVMPLPLFSIYNTSFIELRLFQKIMQMQFGFDAYYFTSYYAKAYMPATGMFYSQTNKKVGNYPYADVFLNIKIKRARFSLCYDNITWFLPNGKNYFAPHYPFNPGILKVGISWIFYD